MPLRMTIMYADDITYLCYKTTLKKCMHKNHRKKPYNFVTENKYRKTIRSLDGKSVGQNKL